MSRPPPTLRAGRFKLRGCFSPILKFPSHFLFVMTNSNTDSQQALRPGQRVVLGKSLGTVRWVGALGNDGSESAKDPNDIWCGVEVISVLLLRLRVRRWISLLAIQTDARLVAGILSVSRSMQYLRLVSLPQ